jgi:DNA-binding response OmpR family regulator
MGAPSIARILVVEDDPRVREELVHGLSAAGFGVTAAADAGAGLASLDRGSISMVVLDLGLPDQDGFRLLEERRDVPAVPTIVLTARTDVRTRIRAFELGAIDYLAKPFFMAELVARIRARLTTAAAAEEKRRRRAFADVVVDLDARIVTGAGGTIELTRAEFEILAYLVTRPGRAVSRSTLAERALDPSGERFERTIDSHVSRLRGKLGSAGREHLHTVWGIGWRFDP